MSKQEHESFPEEWTTTAMAAYYRIVTDLATSDVAMLWQNVGYLTRRSYMRRTTHAQGPLPLSAVQWRLARRAIFDHPTTVVPIGADPRAVLLYWIAAFDLEAQETLWGSLVVRTPRTKRMEKAMRDIGATLTEDVPRGDRKGKWWEISFTRDSNRGSHRDA